MYFRGFHIDGFGVFSDQGAADLPRGLVLFVGHNESGKTTLMEFVRFVLFGSRPRSANDYAPMSGGSHSGRLQLVLKDGRQCTVERSGKKVTIAGAAESVAEEDPSRFLLGGLDRLTYECVFAIGLDELQGLDVLSQEQVRARLLSAGVGLGTASLPEALARLDKTLDDLLKPRGRTQVITKLLNRTRQLEGQLREVRNQASEYAQCRHALSELEARVQSCRDESLKIDERVRRIEQLERARESWLRRDDARHKQAALGHASNFPPNGLSQLETLKRDVGSLAEECAQAEDEAREIERNLEVLVPDRAILERRADVESLVAEREKLSSALDDLPERHGDVKQARQDCDKLLKDLGSEWTLEKLESADTSVQVRQEVQGLARRYDKADADCDNARADLRAIRDTCEDAQRAVDEARRRFERSELPAVPSASELNRKRKALRNLHDAFQTRSLTEARIDALQTEFGETQRRIESLQAEQGVSPPHLPWWMLIVVLALGMIIGTALILQGTVITAIGTYIGAVAIVYLLYRFDAQQAKAESARQQRLRDEIDRLQEAGLTSGTRHARFQSRQEKIVAEIRKLATDAGFDVPQQSSDVARLDAELDRWSDQLQSWSALKQELDKAEAHLKTVSGRLDKEEDKAARAESNFKLIQEDWQAWLAVRRFSPEVRPDGFEVVLQAVERARSARQQLEADAQRLKSVEEYVAGVRGRIKTLLIECDRPDTAAEPDLNTLDALARDLREAQRTLEQRRELETRLAALRSAQKRSANKLNEIERQIDALIQTAGAEDEAAFLLAAKAFDQWEALTQQVERDELALLTLAGNAHALDGLEHELADSDPVCLDTERQSISQRRSILEEDIKADLDEIASVKHRLSQLASDETQSNLLLEHRSLQEQLSDAVRQWAGAVVCRSLLEQARDVYERERQPNVIREASGILAELVGGRYRLISVVGQHTVELEETGGLRRKVESAWSSGLADQVYLATRLGLAREFGRHSEPQPVILDDILVRFDPWRQAAAARVLLEFARQQQVFLFSCRPELRDVVLHARAELHDTPFACYRIRDGRIEADWVQPQSALRASAPSAQ